MGPSASFILALSLFYLTGAMGCCNRLTADFCVRRSHSKPNHIGCKCKNPNKVTADDFFFSGLDKPGNISNSLGSSVIFVGVDAIPGLNLLGLSLLRIDYASGGIIPPHYHPRGSEILTVIEGALGVGFITSDERIIIKFLVKGDIFVFPIGLIHFQINIGIEAAVAISALSCESPGIIFVADSLFGSDPRISIDTLKSRFPMPKNTRP